MLGETQKRTSACKRVHVCPSETDMGGMMEEKEKQILSDMFLREKPTKILLDIHGAKGKIYATMLSKDADCTYSHTIKVLNLFKKMGLVTFDKKGRIKIVSLTDAGWEIAHNLDTIAKKLEEVESSMMKESEPAEKKTKSKKK